MKKFLFILLLVIVTSKKKTNTAEPTTIKDRFDEFVSNLKEGPKKAYVWLKNNELFDKVKTALSLGGDDAIKKAQKYCQTYFSGLDYCNNFVKQYDMYLKEI